MWSPDCAQRSAVDFTHEMCCQLSRRKHLFFTRPQSEHQCLARCARLRASVSRLHGAVTPRAARGFSGPCPAWPCGPRDQLLRQESRFLEGRWQIPCAFLLGGGTTPLGEGAEITGLSLFTPSRNFLSLPDTGQRGVASQS